MGGTVNATVTVRVKVEMRRHPGQARVELHHVWG